MTNISLSSLQKKWMKLEDAVFGASSKKRSETLEKKAVMDFLKKDLGYSKTRSVTIQDRTPDGRIARVYLWRDTPIGTIALSTGPNVQPDVHFMIPVNVGLEKYSHDPSTKLFLNAKGSRPALMQIPVPKRLSKSEHSKSMTDRASFVKRPSHPKVGKKKSNPVSSRSLHTWSNSQPISNPTKSKGPQKADIGPVSNYPAAKKPKWAATMIDEIKGADAPQYFNAAMEAAIVRFFLRQVFPPNKYGFSKDLYRVSVCQSWLCHIKIHSNLKDGTWEGSSPQANEKLKEIFNSHYPLTGGNASLDFTLTKTGGAKMDWEADYAYQGAGGWEVPAQYVPYVESLIASAFKANGIPLSAYGKDVLLKSKLSKKGSGGASMAAKKAGKVIFEMIEEYPALIDQEEKGMPEVGYHLCIYGDTYPVNSIIKMGVSGHQDAKKLKFNKNKTFFCPPKSWTFHSYDIEIINRIYATLKSYLENNPDLGLEVETLNWTPPTNWKSYLPTPFFWINVVNYKDLENIIWIKSPYSKALIATVKTLGFKWKGAKWKKKANTEYWHESIPIGVWYKVGSWGGNDFHSLTSMADDFSELIKEGGEGVKHIGFLNFYDGPPIAQFPPNILLSTQQIDIHNIESWDFNITSDDLAKPSILIEQVQSALTELKVIHAGDISGANLVDMAIPDLKKLLEMNSPVSLQGPLSEKEIDEFVALAEKPSPYAQAYDIGFGKKTVSENEEAFYTLLYNNFHVDTQWMNKEILFTSTGWEEVSFSTPLSGGGTWKSDISIYLNPKYYDFPALLTPQNMDSELVKMMGTPKGYIIKLSLILEHDEFFHAEDAGKFSGQVIVKSELKGVKHLQLSDSKEVIASQAKNALKQLFDSNMEIVGNLMEKGKKPSEPTYNIGFGEKTIDANQAAFESYLLSAEHSYPMSMSQELLSIPSKFSVVSWIMDTEVIEEEEAHGDYFNKEIDKIVFEAKMEMYFNPKEYSFAYLKPVPLSDKAFDLVEFDPAYRYTFTLRLTLPFQNGTPLNNAMTLEGTLVAHKSASQIVDVTLNMGKTIDFPSLGPDEVPYAINKAINDIGMIIKVVKKDNKVSSSTEDLYQSIQEKFGSGEPSTLEPVGIKPGDSISASQISNFEGIFLLVAIPPGFSPRLTILDSTSDDKIRVLEMKSTLSGQVVFKAKEMLDLKLEGMQFWFENSYITPSTDYALVYFASLDWLNGAAVEKTMNLLSSFISNLLAAPNLMPLSKTEYTDEITVDVYAWGKEKSTPKPTKLPMGSSLEGQFSVPSVLKPTDGTFITDLPSFKSLDMGAILVAPDAENDYFSQVLIKLKDGSAVIIDEAGEIVEENDIQTAIEVMEPLKFVGYLNKIISTAEATGQPNFFDVGDDFDDIVKHYPVQAYTDAMNQFSKGAA